MISVASDNLIRIHNHPSQGDSFTLIKNGCINHAEILSAERWVSCSLLFPENEWTFWLKPNDDSHVFFYVEKNNVFSFTRDERPGETCYGIRPVLVLNTSSLIPGETVIVENTCFTAISHNEIMADDVLMEAFLDEFYTPDLKFPYIYQRINSSELLDVL